MPISSTIRRLDNGIIINADGLRVDEGGSPSGSIFGGSYADPNNYISAAGPSFYIGDDESVWMKPKGSTGKTGWVNLVAAA